MLELSSHRVLNQMPSPDEENEEQADASEWSLWVVVASMLQAF